jgi:hypothetical protein
MLTVIPTDIVRDDIACSEFELEPETTVPVMLAPVIAAPGTGAALGAG